MRPFSRRRTGTSKAHAERRIAVTIFCLRERLRLQFQKNSFAPEPSASALLYALGKYLMKWNL